MKIIIVGCGRQGSNLALTLVDRGHQVTIIDPDPESFERLGPNFRGKTINGVVFDREVLIEAGIEHADGLAAMAPSDDANIVTALLARNVFHVPQVVARVYDPRQRHIYGRLGLQTISPVEIGNTYVINLLVNAELESVMTFGNGEMVLVQSEVPMTMVGRQVQLVTIPGELCVVSIVRGNHAFVPTLGTIFQAGDVAFFSIMTSSMSRLSQLLGMA